MPHYDDVIKEFQKLAVRGHTSASEDAIDLLKKFGVEVRMPTPKEKVLKRLKEHYGPHFTSARGFDHDWNHLLNVALGYDLDFMEC